MRRVLKWAGSLLLVGVLAVSALVAFAWWRSEQARARTYAIADAPLQQPTDAASLAHGRHLFESRGCDECHAPGGVGGVVMDAGPLLKLVASNITPGELAARGYDADGVAAAIRHGVRPDGTPLVFMPANDYSELSDADTAALVAYLRTLPESANQPGPTELRPLGRVLWLFDRFPLFPAEQVDHAPRARVAPAVAADAAYGGYVAAVCTGCHGANLAGGPPMAPNTPPVANLTPQGALGRWQEADFLRAMRAGVRPDGSAIDPFMPWKTFARMSDTELRALWAHLRALPPVPSRD